MTPVEHVAAVALGALLAVALAGVVARLASGRGDDVVPRVALSVLVAFVLLTGAGAVALLTGGGA